MASATGPLRFGAEEMLDELVPAHPDRPDESAREGRRRRAHNRGSSDTRQ